MQPRSTRVRRRPVPKDVELLPSVTRSNRPPDAQDKIISTQMIEGQTSQSRRHHQDDIPPNKEPTAATEEEALPLRWQHTEALESCQIQSLASRMESAVHGAELAATTVANTRAALLFLGVKTPTITQPLVVKLQLSSGLQDSFTALDLIDAVSALHHPHLSGLRTMLQGQIKTYIATSNHPIPIGALGYTDPYNGYRSLGAIGEASLQQINQILPAAQSPLRTLLLKAQRSPPETELYVMYIEQEVAAEPPTTIQAFHDVMHPLSIAFPLMSQLLLLLKEKQVGNGMVTYMRHRVVQHVLAGLRMTISQTDVQKAIPGLTGQTTNPKDVVQVWVGFTSVKSYRNKLKVLRNIHQASVVAHSDGNYINQALVNINQPFRTVVDILSGDDLYPTGYDVKWPELASAIAVD